MKRRHKVRILKGRIISWILSFLLSPIMIPIALLEYFCGNILAGATKIRRWIEVTLDNNNQSHE